MSRRRKIAFFTLVAAALFMMAVGLGLRQRAAHADNSPCASPMSSNAFCQLHGKVKFVDSFPKYKIQYVKSFPDIKVKWVDSFPDKQGEWKRVDSFPDFTVQVVDSFPDFKVQVVDSFPGCP